MQIFWICVQTEFVEEQLKHQHLQKLLQDNSTSLNLAKVHVPNSNLDIVCDISIGKICPFVPESFQHIFFSSLHNLSHLGANASIKLLTEICLASYEVGYSTMDENL